MAKKKANPPSKQDLAMTMALPSVASLIVFRESRVLLSKRLEMCRHMPGCWQFPGGAIKHGESIEEAARREIAEETGLVDGLTYCGLVHAESLVLAEGGHWVCLFPAFTVDKLDLPPNPEPDKHHNWTWVHTDAPLLEPAMPGIAKAINSYKINNILKPCRR